MTITKIFLIGLMGSGKSYWGQQLSRHFGYPFVDLDKGIEAAEQKNISEIFEQKGEDFFRQKEKQILHQLNEDYLKCVMSCGGGTPCFFDNMEWMKKNGIVIWLHPPIEILAERLIANKETRPLIKNAHSVQEIISILSQQMDIRKPFYNQAHFKLEEPYPTIEGFKNLLKNA